MFKTAFEILPFVFALLLVPTYVLPAYPRGGGVPASAVRWQALWCMAILLCASKFLAYAAFGGDAFMPELPEKLIWTWNWAYSGMCLLLAFSIPWALILLVLCKGRGVRGPALGDALRRYGRIVLPLVAWSLSAIGLYNGVKVPEVVEVTVESDRVPAELDGYRILQLSDTHVSAAARRWRTMAVVSRANAANADLIVFTGDIEDGRLGRQAKNVQPLCGLRAKDGVWFITGNHEYYSDWPAWEARYRRWGFRFLENAWTSPHAGLVIAGVPDPADNRNMFMARYGETPNPDKAFAGAPKDAFRILLQHRPYVDYSALRRSDVPVASTEPFDLQLSGHTHGGVGPIMRSVVARFNHGYVRGFYDLPNGARLYVSPGAGQWAGFPMRFRNDPEITVFTLKKSKSEK